MSTVSKSYLGRFEPHPTNASLYFNDFWLSEELLDVLTELRLDFCLKTGERRNCKSVNLSPRRSFLKTPGRELFGSVREGRSRK